MRCQSLTFYVSPPSLLSHFLSRSLVLSHTLPPYIYLYLSIHLSISIYHTSESSNYFGYQVYANYYGFLKTKQQSARWTRLITARDEDDLSAKFPTFTAHRHPCTNQRKSATTIIWLLILPYMSCDASTVDAWRYGPLNKADVLEKWFASPQAPQEEVASCLSCTSLVQ